MRAVRYLARRRYWAVGVALLLTFALAACGGSPTATPTSTASQPTPTPTATPTLAPGQTPTATPTPTPITFAGDTINIVVGFAPGGGFDTFSRILAVHLKDTLPGNPTIVVSNLPGADTVVAAKQVLNDKPQPHKIEIANVISSTVLNMALGNVSDLSVNDFKYIGVPDKVLGDQVLCGRASVVSSLTDMMTSGKTYTVAGLGGTTNYDLNVKGAKALGAPLDIVWGYGGSSEMIAAFNRGEVDTTPSCRQADVDLNPQWITDNYIVPLIYFDAKPKWLTDGQAAGKWSDVKSVLDFNPNPDPNVLAAVKANQTLSRGTRVYAVSANVSDDVVAALRAGMQKVVESQSFIDDMKQRGYDSGWMSGDEYQQTMQNILQMPPAGLKALKDLLAPAS